MWRHCCAVVDWCNLSAPFFSSPLCAPRPRLPPPTLSFCWETKNVQASVFRRNKDKWCQDREEGPRRHLHQADLSSVWLMRKLNREGGLKKGNTQFKLVWTHYQMEKYPPFFFLHSCTLSLCVVSKTVGWLCCCKVELEFPVYPALSTSHETCCFLLFPPCSLLSQLKKITQSKWWHDRPGQSL